MNITISKINSKEIPYLILYTADNFHELPKEVILNELPKQTNFSISLKATIDDKFAGVYFLTDYYTLDAAIKMDLKTPIIFEDLAKYKNKNGLFGLILLTTLEHRNLGVAKKLIESAENMNYDFIFGLHYKTTPAVNMFVNDGRRIIGEDNELFITLKDLK